MLGAVRHGWTHRRRKERVATLSHPVVMGTPDPVFKNCMTSHPSAVAEVDLVVAPNTDK